MVTGIIGTIKTSVRAIIALNCPIKKNNPIGVKIAIKICGKNNPKNDSRFSTPSNMVVTKPPVRFTSLYLNSNSITLE